MTEIKTRIRMNDITHSVRRSQAVLQYGVGAMIDFPSQVLMTATSELWENPDIIHDERLEKLLGVSEFITPSDYGIPFVRFPRWYFCPKCRKFKPIEEWQKEFKAKSARKNTTDNDPYMIGKPVCSEDRQELVPARIVTVCKHGHIDDFPWVKWVHRKNRFGEKEVCSHPQLLFKTGSSATSGLEGVEVECTNCGAKASLFGAFNKDTFEVETKDSKFGADFHCTGRHPWKNEKSMCSEYPQTKQRGASSVYFPRIISSLVIPPYSGLLNDKIEKSDALRKLSDIIGDGIDDFCCDKDKEEFILKKIDKYIDEFVKEICENKEAIFSILRRKFSLSENTENKDQDKELLYKSEEYKALTGVISGESFGEDEFKRESVDSDAYGLRGVKSIALIHKVKEVTALIGFSRIQPTNDMDESSEGVLVSVKRKKTSTVRAAYPATMSRGEGIFIEFDKDKLEKFFNAEPFNSRSKQLNDRYNNSFYGKNRKLNVDSVFLFLHTMSHLLIKELSFSCGYSTASIRERLYYGEAGGENMCGVFIYTTGGDSEGTLGGLVRQGQIDCLPRVFSHAIESAKFCANDPVCSFSEGQGMDALNYAACHTCALLPETCCEFSNTLLDRVVVVGNMDDSVKGYYSDSVNKIE